jgi:hypothetical protein
MQLSRLIGKTNLWVYSLGSRSRPEGHAVQSLPRKDWPRLQRHPARSWCDRQQKGARKNYSQEVGIQIDF